MYHPLLPTVARIHQDHLLERAKLDRLGRVAGNPGFRLGRRLLARLGDLLISLGLWLRHRYGPAIPVGRGTYLTGGSANGV
ncbi:MAG TPA: hypothetical protein VLY63_13340 [Anaerolineae bacterium]|nr:hypothetical protein [Anaerolineae bacterium]